MRIRFKDGELKNFINELIINENITLRELSSVLSVNYSTMKNFYQETRTVPYNIIEDMCKKYRLDFPYNQIEKELLNNWGQIKGGKKGIQTTFRIYKHKLKEWRSKGGTNASSSRDYFLPKKVNEKFSEFYGILCGDGCLFGGESLHIVGNKSLDSHYILNYVCPLINNLFGVNPHIYYQGNTIRVVLYSKGIVKFINSLGFPMGKKKNSEIKIPDEIKKNVLFAKAFIRGMLDTDGCVVPHRKTSMILSICIMNPQLLEATKGLCEITHVDFSYLRDRIHLSTVEKIKCFFREIGSSNLRNIIRFDHYMKDGYSIRASEIERFLTSYSKIKLPYYSGL